MLLPYIRVGVVLVALFVRIPLLNGAVFFPSNSAYGIFAAIAVPLDLGPHRNVFVSYNFEANYNLPVNWQIPTYLDIGANRRMKGKPIEEHKGESVTVSNTTDLSIEAEYISKNTTYTASAEDEEVEKPKNRERRSLLSRKVFYNMLKQKLQMHGYSGESCLLRLICETNAFGIGDINGFLGSIIHIIFAPSSSIDEGLSEIYYKAEFDGQQSECTQYEEKCPENILDFISTPVHEIMNTLRKK